MNAPAEINEPGKARPAQHEDLSAKFGGLLPKPSTQKPTPTPAPANPEPRPATMPAAATEAPLPAPEGAPAATTTRTGSQPNERAPRKQRAAGTGASTPPVETNTEGASSKADQAIPFNLPLTLWNRLEAYRKATGISNPNILFNAIEITYDRLPELVAARTVNFGGSDTGATRLFNRPATAAQRAADSEPKKQLIIRVNKENKQVLDDLWPEVGAPNRTVMVVAALDEFLPNDD
jgi:hypothetical protein